MVAVVKEVGQLRAEKGSLDAFLTRCAAALDAVYCHAVEAAGADPGPAYGASVRYTVRLLAVLMSAESIPLGRSSSASIRRAAAAVLAALEDSGDAAFRQYEEATLSAQASSGLAVFAPIGYPALGPAAFRAAAELLLQPWPDAPIESIYYDTMPLSWLGRAYQHMLAFRPEEPGGALRVDHSHRKGRGIYFTPASLVSYITESVLAPLSDLLAPTLHDSSRARETADLKVLDPSMGGGDFLAGAIDFICGIAAFGSGDTAEALRAEVAGNCVYGLDLDPAAVEIARFSVWAASAYADGIGGSINAHLICGDALDSGPEGSGRFEWAEAFPEVFAGRESPGFDAVVGNPPYIAAKNGLRLAPSRRAGRGQSDSYLLFLQAALDNRLVRPGGMLSMVLPDPMLVRENAAPVRRKLMSDWTLVSLLHISNAFPEAHVANVVPVCRNSASDSPTFLVSRIDRAADRRSFALRPARTAMELAHTVRGATVQAQDRCEFLYLLESGAFTEIICRIHGDSVSLSSFLPPFAPLRSLNIQATYRGEEIGKAAIGEEAGELQMLMGGQSIGPYEILWEGRRIARSRVKKSTERYASTKLLIQKSSARLIAALDQVTRAHRGYVFPQSVYAVELRPSGMHELYLLCILNSEVMNEYIWRAVTGYKLLQPQLELEDIRSLPIRRINFTTPELERETELAKGIRMFEDESLRAGDRAPFPELANFVVRCLTGNPEMSDVVHDLLVYLGRLVVDLTRSGRASPDADTTRRLEVTRAAVETVVWQLYSSEPAQMSLPW